MPSKIEIAELISAIPPSPPKLVPTLVELPSSCPFLPPLAIIPNASLLCPLSLVRPPFPTLIVYDEPFVIGILVASIIAPPPPPPELIYNSVLSLTPPPPPPPPTIKISAVQSY